MGGLRGTNLKKSLTPRDFDIFYHLASYGFATRKQLFSLFWTGSHKSCAHHRRIRHLADLNLIEKIVSDSGELGLKITQKGLNILKEKHPEARNMKLIRRSYRSQFEHDSLVQRVVSTMEQSSIVLQSETEKQLIRKLYIRPSPDSTLGPQPRVPDALVLIETLNGPKWAAIEVELTRKSNNRYYSLLRHHLIAKDWDLIFYVVKDQKLKEVISKNHQYCLSHDPKMKIHEKINGLYIVKLDDLLEKKNEALFVGQEDQFSLESLSQKLTEKHSNPNCSKAVPHNLASSG